ncbi:hypothetical protein KC19_7G028700 [Ceratodon purpureus]|uniref:Uncharacterized protein n=1 Tax=Ceratodon purpureus TaxID=3225 RepID=A0A8T0H5K9_CERPU|nr:hypothetical protein KC19_7G028500 [Ceratodon purpureus]KAG0565979.1 hypothetical protein KC19_7G028700 [Ceratodon purpureus]
MIRITLTTRDSREQMQAKAIAESKTGADTKELWSIDLIPQLATWLTSSLQFCQLGDSRNRCSVRVTIASLTVRCQSQVDNQGSMWEASTGVNMIVLVPIDSNWVTGMDVPAHFGQLGWRQSCKILLEIKLICLALLCASASPKLSASKFHVDSQPHYSKFAHPEAVHIEVGSSKSPKNNTSRVSETDTALTSGLQF